MRNLILVVDDDEIQKNMLSKILTREGYRVETSSSAHEALELFKSKPVDLVITDIRMPQMTGRELLHRAKEIDPDVPIILITAYAELQDAIEMVTHEGAFYYFQKPINVQKMLEEIKRALNLRNIEKGEEGEKEKAPRFEGIVGESPKMEKLYREMARVILRGPNTVLITGESGTGKELVARAIHRYGRRKSGRFVPVNVSAIPATLLESELFGHERGAFTDAKTRKIGLFEEADGGTIFLDEIGELDANLQVKLLRVIEEREFQRVGGTKPIKVDLCVITATNKNLEQEVRAGRFREDLYYRLNVIPLHVPPLRERKEDIPLLVEHFLRKFAEQYGTEPKRLTPRAISFLRRYDWPGNVRQLENVIHRAFIMVESDTIDVDDLPEEVKSNVISPAKPETQIEIPEGGISLEEVERLLILAALQRAKGNQVEAARLLGISRRRLQYRMEKYGIPSRLFKDGNQNG
jgi:DNA-binding NtrC family response regulator